MDSFPHLPTLNQQDVTRNFEHLLGVVEGLEEGNARAGATEVVLSDWAPVQSVSAKLSSVTFEAARQGAIGRLSGQATANAGVPSGTILFTLPLALRPLVSRFMPVYNASTTAVGRASIKTSGEVEYVGAEITAPQIIDIEGVTFRLA